ncbi:MAG TPA: SDR family NAD(P)-dependent oxidoreductase [Candidatus Binatia bacterium]|nr:SDR family NAD(P)-dependent oxidoreductase [Candidatus Binatia bacterium]
MDLGLQGRAAVVTGGASGIGAAIALALAREGCDVAVMDARFEAAGSRVLQGIEAAGRRGLRLQGDVRDAAFAERAIQDVVAAFGRLDILVCAAGITADAVSWKMTPAQWDDVIGVNLTGCFLWSRAAGAVLRDRGWGRIVNIASINGLRGKAGQANYAASKGGMVALSKSLAKELGRSGVTVNVVAPGMVKTPMTAPLPDRFVEAAIEESAVGRIAEPEDCASAVAWLCSAGARHVTGQVLKVDGGQYV